MRKLTILLVAICMIGCDDKDKAGDATSTSAATTQRAPLPVTGDAFFVVERTSDADAPFHEYTTHEVVSGDDGPKVKQSFSGFQVAAGGNDWSWNLEEKSVPDSRDCSCDTFAREGCTSETTMIVAELSQQGKEQRWRPPIYDNATRDLASWRTSSARARVRGDLLFTSVCLEVMKCGETPRPVCQSTVWSLAGDSPKVVPLDTLGTPPGDDIVATELERAKPGSKAEQALTQAVEAESDPVLVEVLPELDGTVRQRWVVPSDIRATGDWTAYTFSVMHTGPASGLLEPFAPLPRLVSIFTNGRDGTFVGWSVHDTKGGQN
jgi:hypothetical protein